MIFTFSYFTVIILVFISSSLWKLYYGLELQWMMIVLFFIIAYSIYRGFFNYLLINLFVSMLIMLGLIYICIINVILGCYGKLGYFPFIIVLITIISSVSFIFIVYDYYNKTCYFNLFNINCYINILYYGIDYIIILFNYPFIFSFSLFISSTKHLLFVISFFIILLIIMIQLIPILYYSINYYFIYLINLILLLTII